MQRMEGYHIKQAQLSNKATNPLWPGKHMPVHAPNHCARHPKGGQSGTQGKARPQWGGIKAKGSMDSQQLG